MVFCDIFSTVSQVPPYYDFDNSDDDDDDNDGENKQSKYQQHPEASTERKSSQMLRARRAANIFNENYVTDTQNNGK